MGEQGQALANAAAIPNWFFEGDAIYAEPNYSKQGRGSLPSFYNDYRALWKANKNYSWMKLRNGSFKDFVPDHYALGYLLVAYGYEKYGDHFWKKVTHDAAAYKHLFYPFQHALKKHSGVDYPIFRKKAFEFFKAQFEDKKNVRPAGNNENYRDEQYPVFTEDGQILYVKSSFQQRAQFVIKDSTGINKIRTADNTIEPYFSYSNHKIVYASYQSDARCGYRNYSNLQLIDITNGNQYTITKLTKYFSPCINKDGTQIIAVNVPPTGSCQLHLLNVADGNMINSIANPDKLFYTYPKFYNEDSIIAAVRDTEGKMSLALISQL